MIDTSIWIAVERGTLGAADIHAITRQEPVYLSPVNVAEIQFGLQLLKAGARKEKAAAALRRMRRKPQLRITVETAEVFASLAAHLRRTGRDPDVRINDLWLAAQAIQRDFKLLTLNAKDFAGIAGLRVVALPLESAATGPSSAGARAGRARATPRSPSSGWRRSRRSRRAAPAASARSPVRRRRSPRRDRARS